MSNWSDNPELLAATGGAPSSSALQSLQSTGSGSSTSATGKAPPPPGMPDISELQGLYNKVPGLFGTKKIEQSFDNNINTTRSEGFGAASSAAGSYAAREQQMGINPVSAGAVEASARAPTYKAVNDLTSQKEAAKLEAHKEGASIQASIASAMGNIRASYAKTLADYNLGAASLGEKSSEFDRSLDFSKTQLSQGNAIDWAKIMGASPGGGSTAFIKWLQQRLGMGGMQGSPGYLGDFGGPNPAASGDYAYNGHNVDVATI